jgi:hypothetical protein
LKRLPARGEKLLKDGKEVGHITSTIASPTLKVNIALGYVRREANAVGTELDLRSGAVESRAGIGELPFVKQRLQPMSVFEGGAAPAKRRCRGNRAAGESSKAKGKGDCRRANGLAGSTGGFNTGWKGRSARSPQTVNPRPQRAPVLSNPLVVSLYTLHFPPPHKS